MPNNSGLLYFVDLIGLDRDSLRVHYEFYSGTGNLVPNSAPNFPQMSGLLANPTGFYVQSGSGFFTGGNTITIQTPSGLPSENWSHIFIAEKTGRGRGVIWDSLMSGTTGSPIYSGYILGINDNNRLYFESYDNLGPTSKTSNIILGKKNLVAITQANNLITFYCYDFNNAEILSDSQNINGDYLLSANKGVIGAPTTAIPFIEKRNFSGYIDEYLIIQDAITPSTFRYIASGLASTYQATTGIVTSFQVNETTGYQSGITGVTGITGYRNVVTGSGLDPFGTGSYELYYTTSGITGYLATGISITPLTGFVTYYSTGDTSNTLTLRSGYITEFGLDEVSFILKVDTNDIYLGNIFGMFGPTLNKIANYDNVEGLYQLDSIYVDDQLAVYLNGVSQVSTGYAVTGNFYGSGISLSGDYRLNGFYLDSTGFFRDDDLLIFDLFSGAKQRVVLTGTNSGQTENLTVSTGQLIFLNGQLMISGLDYIKNSANNLYTWITNKYQNVSGALTSFPILYNYEYKTGEFLTFTGKIPRRNSQIFFNGIRAKIDTEYLENSSLDLIRQSGILENVPDLVYNNNALYFE